MQTQREGLRDIVMCNEVTGDCMCLTKNFELFSSSHDLHALNVTPQITGALGIEWDRQGKNLVSLIQLINYS